MDRARGLTLIPSAPVLTRLNEAIVQVAKELAAAAAYDLAAPACCRNACVTYINNCGQCRVWCWCVADVSEERPYVAIDIVLC